MVLEEEEVAAAPFALLVADAPSSPLPYSNQSGFAEFSRRRRPSLCYILLQLCTPYSLQETSKTPVLVRFRKERNENIFLLLLRLPLPRGEGGEKPSFSRPEPRVTSLLGLARREGTRENGRTDGRLDESSGEEGKKTEAAPGERDNNAWKEAGGTRRLRRRREANICIDC